ncbi:MAG: DUF4160 domain-containing protein [Actinomycetota bacterium]
MPRNQWHQPSAGDDGLERGSCLAGSLPRRALDLVEEWARLHRAELLANWERARREEPLHPIDSLP